MTSPEVPAGQPDGLQAPGRGGLLLARVPDVLASKPHIWFLVALFVYLVPMGLLLPAVVPDRAQLILGNYTNVMSALGACIAAGATVKIAHNQRQHHRLVQELHAKLDDLHRKP